MSSTGLSSSATQEAFSKWLPRQPAAASGASTSGSLGPLPSRPSCLESSPFRRSVFGTPPLVSLGRFLGRRPFVRSSHCPVPAFPLTQSPEGGSQRCRITRGGPTPRLLGHVSLITQSTLRNGGVVDAVVPCGTSALMTQTTLRNGGVVDAVVPCGVGGNSLALGLATSETVSPTTPDSDTEQRNLDTQIRRYPSNSFGKRWRSFL